MHFDIPWWVWMLFGYIISVVCFVKTVQYDLLGLMHGQIAISHKKKRGRK